MQFGDISDNEIKGFCVHSQFRMMEIITINILAHQHKPVSVNIKCMCQAVGFLWHITRWSKSVDAAGAKTLPLLGNTMTHSYQVTLHHLFVPVSEHSLFPNFYFRHLTRLETFIISFIIFDDVDI